MVDLVDCGRERDLFAWNVGGGHVQRARGSRTARDRSHRTCTVHSESYSVVICGSAAPQCRGRYLRTSETSAGLSLFRHGSTWCLGNAAPLYLFHHVSGDHLKEILLLPCHLPCFRVENTERSNRKTIRSAQGNASVKPQATLFHKRVVCEAGIPRQVAHDQHFIIGDNVTAKGNVARSAASLGKIGWQTGLRFEPLAILIDQS